jgi:hypothetical protein
MLRPMPTDVQVLKGNVLERAAGIEPASSVWKTEVLTITQRPRSVRA